jgi:hypothetical protein
MSNEDSFTVELRADQWDLIVLALEHVRWLTTGGDSAYTIDKLGRTFLRRRCVETMNDIQGSVPEAGK